MLPRSEVVSLLETRTWWRLRANWLYSCVLAGTLEDHGDQTTVTYQIELEDLGELQFAGQQLVLADPYVVEDVPAAIIQALQPVSHHVTAARATIESGHSRVAAAVLSTGVEPVVEWDMARWAGQDLETLEPEGFYGYGVDAGTGCFADPFTAAAASRVLARDAGMLEDPISVALLGESSTGAAVVAPSPSDAPLAVFNSGWGDGYYPTWLGLDQNSRVAVVITDFLISNDPYAPPETPGNEPAQDSHSSTPWWTRLLRRK